MQVDMQNAQTISLDQATADSTPMLSEMHSETSHNQSACFKKMSKFLLSVFIVCLLAQPALANEADENKKFCTSVGGKTEIRHYYFVEGQRKYIRVDCETETHVYEGGLDKRSSLDSIQQAVFAGKLTGKIPVVVIYNTDRKLGVFEHRISKACFALKIKCISRPVSS